MSNVVKYETGYYKDNQYLIKVTNGITYFVDRRIVFDLGPNNLIPEIHRGNKYEFVIRGETYIDGKYYPNIKRGKELQ